MDRPGYSIALATDDSRYRVLVDAITDYAIYMLDPDGRVVSWNSGARRFKGYEAEEIIGDHFSRFYTEEDRAADVPATALRTAAQEGRYETEGWRVRKGGDRFWAHVLIDPIRAPTGELVGFAKITRDLTERRAAEEALRRSEQQFRLLVQGVTDYAIFLLDLDGRVTSWNAGAQRIKGYAPQEIIGQHFSRFYTEADREAGEPALALRTAAAEGRFEKEGWRVRKDGTRFWAHVVIDPIRDDAGVAIGFAKITRDITERRQAQDALDQARQALFQSQKLEAIGQLTGGVAHDFNNLLMAVLGSLELLRKRLPADPKARALLDNAVQGAQRGAALTQRMLAFARKQELELDGVDVPALVRGMTGLLQRSVGPSIKLVMRFPPALPPAFTDANQLEAALLNLVVNARDAMPGGGTVTIGATAECIEPSAGPGLPAGDYIRLAVVDEGDGMDEQTLARATEPFYTTKGVGKGTGLGLSTAHGLAEQSGGRLVLSSRPDHGTTAALWLPRADAVGTPKTPRAAGPPGDERLRPLVVLAVDDDHLVLLNLAAMLEDLGHRPIAASSAAEALERLGETRVDVVITDHAMPQMSGLQLAEEIARRYGDLPVILATGYAELSPGEGETTPRLAKPYTQSELAQILRGVCGTAELSPG
ncbi:PAS domain S-box protein [Phenylobacterium sp. LH3H17]|uniref:hybrid sensor histidine kinase/response regulator n=1 Tax=Phenylobacterium sp. LH3H17 TaxID=2903901 RepID=UPI0020C9B9F5|nr:PAS domain-containing sensor histidine kinase [Phenylobacterium sp. LH3H17]UTP39831.1 PAS domain S-box protein [Phenylobacterium sp. LH3H17]